MLHRSFKPVKCKTSLKLASSRIKLLKNRKDVQVKQMKKELAQLLESGQEQTARIRVEHVIREEKMKSAYDLLEIYCELIAIRMQIIESQKNCPIDLKEAIASVLFASPRCSDVTELQDIRKHFTAKYGKEFVSAAIELRPESGVSRMMVDKLSTKTPDGHEKIKILKEIAEEHNVKWDAKSLEQIELKPPEDLLKAKIIQAEPPPVQTATPSTIQSPQIFAGAEHYQKSSFKQPYSENEIVSSPRVKNQNLEFEDAVAAAKAAAESAEIACRAAKEAAELAREAKLLRQSSTESKKSSGIIDLRRKEDGKEFQNVDNPGHHSFQVKDEEGNNRAGQDKFTRPNRSDSLRSKTSADEKYQNTDQSSQRNSLVDEHPVKVKKQSSFIEERIVKQASSVSLQSNTNNNYGDDDQRSYNHPNLNSSSIDKGEFLDKASVVFDDLGSDDDNNGLDKKPFVNISGNKPSSPPSQPDKLLPVTFDHSDGPGSDTEDEAEKYPLTASSKFNPQPSKNVHIQDPEPVLTKKEGSKINIYPSSDTEDEVEKYPLTASSKPNPQLSKNVHIQDPEPVLTKKEGSKKNIYPSSDTEDEVEKYPLTASSKSNPQPSKNVHIQNPEPVLTKKKGSKINIYPSSDTEDEPEMYPLTASSKFNPQPSKNVHIQDPEPVLTKKEGSKKNTHPSNAKAGVELNSSFDDSDSLNEFGAWYDKELSFDDEPADPSQFRSTAKETTFSKSDEDLPEESILDYGNLRGGFRHQKPRPPPYTKKSSTSQVKPNLMVSDSDSDDSNVVPPRRQSPENKRESFKVNYGKEVNTRTYFHSIDSESEEDGSSQVSAKMDRVGTILSRRTKPTPNSEGRSERISSRTEPSQTKERLDKSESSRTSYNPKPKQEKPVSFRQRTEPAPSKSLTEERLGYSEADSEKTSSTTSYDPKLRRKTESETFLAEKPINSETRSDRISSRILTHQRTEPDQSSSKTMAEEKPEKSEARSDRVSSRTSNDPKPQREKPIVSHHRTELGQSSYKTMSEENPEKSETRSDRVSSRTSNDPKPRKEKPTLTHQRTEPDQTSSKTVAEEKPEKSEARSDRVSSRTSNDPKPQKEKPTLTHHRNELGQSSYKTMSEENPEKSEAGSDRVSSRTSNDPKPQREKPTLTHQRTEPDQSSSKTMSEEKPKKSETNDPKPYQQKPTSFRQRTEPNPPRKEDTCKISTPTIDQPAKTSTEEGLSSESSIKKTSHVHPKLPDYDDIAARLQAIRLNRGQS